MSDMLSAEASRMMASDALASEAASRWETLSGLKPQVRSDISFFCHVYNSVTAHIAHDRLANKYHRLTAPAHAFIRRMDGKTTLADIRADLENQNEVEGENQDFAQLVDQLKSLELIRTGETPNAKSIEQRMVRERRQHRLAALKNPLYIRVPLFDLTRVLDIIEPPMRWAFTPLVGVLYAMLIATALVMAGIHWDSLTEGGLDRFISAENLTLLALVYPVLKLVHEFGHAVVVRHYGGNVRELGVMFLLFMPVPYVDASSSITFTNKWHRIFVDGAGILVELGMASVAMFVWVLAEPGIVRAVAHNVMIISGVSTLLFNGNPLQRFDSYYLLCDLVEIPNLAIKSTKYYSYLISCYLIGIYRQFEYEFVPVERRWFLFYAPLSFLYRSMVLITIALHLAEKYFFVGVILGGWTVFNMFGMPILKGMEFLFFHPSLSGKRKSAIVRAGLLATALVAVTFVPIPDNVVSQGVVWLPDDSALRSSSDGSVQSVQYPSGTQVFANDILIVMKNPRLEADRRKEVSEIQALSQQLEADKVTDQVAASITLERLTASRERLQAIEASIEGLVIRAPHDGIFEAANVLDLPGRFLPRGAQAGYVLEPDNNASIKVAVPAIDADLVRDHVQSIDVRFAGRIGDVYQANLVSWSPTATLNLPSPVLSLQGGGPFAVEKENDDQSKLVNPIFIATIQIPGADLSQRFGSRAFVRFDLGWEPAAMVVYRIVRRNFLKRFAV